MPSLRQALYNNKPILLGLLVAPLGLYIGVQLKDRREEQQKTTVMRAPTEIPENTQIRLELQDRQESQLSVELESLDSKMQRLDEMQGK
ncbi:hypothetical protein DL89DRAFT_298174 [Linderina pennispora]|uniref:Uncharacterized protein n=1 Tax=Linderina pennispora TaxID=61395 RepID=A0A1Y1VQY3_9FUNG|nr:uncharacterized protein DL89DRAFT_298174 [Linderina pennispora]ORX63698.1 hypothetical protein DL89DRAFT_298174 [Linderina pennispora]